MWLQSSPHPPGRPLLSRSVATTLCPRAAAWAQMRWEVQVRPGALLSITSKLSRGGERPEGAGHSNVLALHTVNEPSFLTCEKAKSVLGTVKTGSRSHACNAQGVSQRVSWGRNTLCWKFLRCCLRLDLTSFLSRCHHPGDLEDKAFVSVQSNVLLA